MKSETAQAVTEKATVIKATEEKSVHGQDVKHKEQESTGSKNSTDELISNRDSMGTELPAVMERLAKLNDMCVATAMKCEEKLQKRAAELSGNELEEVLSILSESALLQRLRPCIEPPSSSMKP